jgi:hypothetical protein
MVNRSRLIEIKRELDRNLDYYELTKRLNEINQKGGRSYTPKSIERAAIKYTLLVEEFTGRQFREWEEIPAVLEGMVDGSFKEGIEKLYGERKSSI